MKTNSKLISILVLIVIISLAGGLWWMSDSANNNESDTSSATVNQSKLKDQSSDASNESEVVVRGTFQDLAKSGTGSVEIRENKDGTRSVVFGEDFEVTKGPDLFVSFGNDNEIDMDTLISELDSNAGAQTYELPEDFNLDDYSQVIIYCKEFSAKFAVADLN